VYLIDEVHMFSSHSFNALLKTLEEPPPHVKFLLATTDPQKVPVTVLSRCLQFSLNRLPIEQIEAQFEHILGAENIERVPEALYLLARAADGSMRDGLSLLDQAIAFGGGSVKLEEVRDMLGVVASDQLPGLLLDAHRGQADQVLATVQAIAQRSPDFSALLKDLLTLLHRVSLLQATPSAWQGSWGDRSQLDELAAEL
jgi:DNA polymerase-3 subunit gamma/tau